MEGILYTKALLSAIAILMFGDFFVLFFPNSFASIPLKIILYWTIEERDGILVANVEWIVGRYVEDMALQ